MRKGRREGGREGGREGRKERGREGRSEERNSCSGTMFADTVVTRITGIPKIGQP